MTEVRTPLHVLVVDDSAVVRELARRLLARVGGFSVDVAADPLIARSKIAARRPDVILLDLEMPREDGLSFLHDQMRRDPIPVVVCSALAADRPELAVAALEQGALEVVPKPRLGVARFLDESALQLADALRAAASAGRSALPRRREAVAPGQAEPARVRVGVTTDRVIAIAASTGGTEALRTILDALPPDCPGLAIVQHMPAGFTRAFAARLDQSSKLEVTEARDGDRITPGRALIAPGGCHLEVRRSGAVYVAAVRGGPLVNRHRPSADVLFSSVARACGSNALGVVLTGMGADGAEGLLRMRRAGARTLAQDEASSVVFGMPAEAGKRNAVEQFVAIDQMADAIVRRLQRASASVRAV